MIGVSGGLVRRIKLDVASQKSQLQHPCDCHQDWVRRECLTHMDNWVRRKAFEDFLLMSACPLNCGRMEVRYLEAVKKHSEGKKGKRGYDANSQMFGALVASMEQDNHDDMKDRLGDLVLGAITSVHFSNFTAQQIRDLAMKM